MRVVRKYNMWDVDKYESVYELEILDLTWRCK